MDQKLALQSMNETSHGDRLLEFSLGHEFYAIPLLSVREVIPVPETTQIPKAPAHFLGIMNLRGQVISVIDLRKKLKIEHRPADAEDAVIIVNLAGMHIGVVVDSINKVLTFSPDEISSVPEVQSQIKDVYISGVLRKEDKLVILVDIAKVLDVKDLTVLKEKAA